jgi:glyoxylase I family protein
MQLRGLHHVTAICRDAEQTIAFYRDVLGLAIVHDGPSEDDPESRHVWFGAMDGGPGKLVSFMQYPELPKGVVGVGSTHHFALLVESSEEQEAWRDYLRGRGIECSDIFDRGALRSTAQPRPAQASRGAANGSTSTGSPQSRAASSRRWRSVMDPIVLVSFIATEVKKRRQRVRPQRCWLISRSAMAMLSASQGHSSTTSATDSSPSPTWRLSSARASRTLLAWASACMC